MVEDDVKTRILREATRLFAASGFDGTSIQAVAEAAGIRRPTLIYHFGSKDQLRQAVLDSVLARWKGDLPAMMSAATGGTGDRLDTAMSAMMSFFREDRSRARLLVREMLDRPQEVRGLLETHLQPWTALLTDVIRRGQASGNFQAGVDPGSYIIQIITMALGTIATGDVAVALMSGEPNDTEPLMDELVRIARLSLFVPKDTRTHEDPSWPTSTTTTTT